RTEEEVEAVLDVLPKGSQIVGFYSYGEISPYASGQCDLHNQTMTLTTLSESPTPVPRVAPPAEKLAALPSIPVPPAGARPVAPRAAPPPTATPMPAAARAGNGAAHHGNGKVPGASPTMGALDLDISVDEPNTPRGGTVKMPMRGFRVESFSYDAARGEWSRTLVPAISPALEQPTSLERGNDLRSSWNGLGWSNTSGAPKATISVRSESSASGIPGTDHLPRAAS